MEKQNLKALYESPKLVEHGDVKKITLNTGPGQADTPVGDRRHIPHDGIS